MGVEGGGSEKPAAPEATGEGCGGGEGTGSPRPVEGVEPEVWGEPDRRKGTRVGVGDAVGPPLRLGTRAQRSVG